MMKVLWAEMIMPDGFKWILCGKNVPDGIIAHELFKWLDVANVKDIKVWIA